MSDATVASLGPGAPFADPVGDRLLDIVEQKLTTVIIKIRSNIYLVEWMILCFPWHDLQPQLQLQDLLLQNPLK